MQNILVTFHNGCSSLTQSPRDVETPRMALVINVIIIENKIELFINVVLDFKVEQFCLIVLRFIFIYSILEKQ